MALQSMPCLVNARHCFCQDRATACVLAKQPICCLSDTAVIPMGAPTIPDKLLAALMQAYPLSLIQLQLCRVLVLLAQSSLCWNRKRIGMSFKRAAPRVGQQDRIQIPPSPSETL